MLPSAQLQRVLGSLPQVTHLSTIGCIFFSNTEDKLKKQVHFSAINQIVCTTFTHFNNEVAPEAVCAFFIVGQVCPSIFCAERKNEKSSN